MANFAPKSWTIDTPEGKAFFITTLCNSIRDSVIGAVQSMPREWDGHELRELLAELFDRERGDLLYRARTNVRRNRLDRKRMSNYRVARYALKGV